MKYDIAKLARDLWGSIGPKLFNMPNAAMKAQAKTFGIPLGVFQDAAEAAVRLFASKEYQDEGANMDYKKMKETNDFVDGLMLTEDEEITENLEEALDESILPDFKYLSDSINKDKKRK